MPRIKGIIGDGPPYLTGTKASKARVFDAILQTKASLLTATSLDFNNPKNCIVYQIEIDESEIENFQKIARTIFSTHQHIVVNNAEKILNEDS